MCLYVQNLRFDEGRKLQSILRRSKNRIRVRRAQVILASEQGFKVPDIAKRFYFSPKHVRTIIKEFNEYGLKAIEPRQSDYCYSPEVFGNYLSNVGK